MDLMDAMDETPRVAPVIAPESAEHGLGSPAAVQPEEGPRRERPWRRNAHVPDWWRTRNRLGVRNWELLVIVLVALVAGMAAMAGSSIMGVR